MKKILYPIFFTLCALLTSSCDNEPLEGEFGNLDDGSNGSSGGSFVATIDGNSFVADQAQAVASSGMTLISGVTTSGESISLTFSGSTTGSYELNTSNFGSYTAPGSTNPYTTNASATGSLTISEVTENSISGTFSFTAQRTVTGEDGTDETQSVQITAGSFTNILFSGGNGGGGSGGGSNSDALFEVELDGELFEGEEIVDAVLNEDGLLISATQGNQQVGFQIFDPAVGTYDINAESSEGIVLYDPDNTDNESTSYASASGTLEITALDMANGTISGTFSGVLQDLFMEEADIQMTNGIFENISFSTDGPTNTGSATIDGESFNANIFPVVYVNNQIQVSLDNDLDEKIIIYFPEDITTGTHTVGDGNSVEDYSASYSVENAGNTTDYYSVADSGEIIVDSFQNDIVSGTFNFTVENTSGDTITITNGEFTVDVSF